MKESRFLQRLRTELPAWIQKGWVLEEKQQAILNYVAEQDKSIKTSSTFIFAIFGILLFVAGVISFFAANWNIIPKLLKLVMLFSAMWGAYALAYVGFYWKQDLDNHNDLTGEKGIHKSRTVLTSHSSVIAHFSFLFLLLGTLLFGANIWLIAQIYNIEAFYPTGVLIWSLAALLAAGLLGDSLTLALSITLGLLWTGLDTAVFNFQGIVHWQYLILWFAQLVVILLLRKRALFNLAMISLVLWSIFSISGIQFNLYFIQLYALLACTFIMIGTLALETTRLQDFKKFSLSLRHWGLFLVFAALYFLALPRFITASSLQPKMISDSVDFYPEPYSVGLGITVLIMIVNILLIFVHYMRSNVRMRARAGERMGNTRNYVAIPLRFYFGLVLYLSLNIFMLGTFSVEYLKSNGWFFSLFFNIIFFLGTLWLIQLGTQTKDKFCINLGCFFFAIGLLTRYFDTFWTLLNRSFFFMLGGLLLIVGSYFIEKYRRFSIEKINEDLPKQ